MHQRAQKRETGPIEVLGKIGDERATETLHDYIDGDGDPALQKVTLRALGAIGSAESVQPVANRLDADSEEVRSVAARALGCSANSRHRAAERCPQIRTNGTSCVLRRGSLRQIGTETALDEAARYTDDRAYSSSRGRKGSQRLNQEPSNTSGRPDAPMRSFAPSSVRARPRSVVVHRHSQGSIPAASGRRRTVDSRSVSGRRRRR